MVGSIAPRHGNIFRNDLEALFGICPTIGTNQIPDSADPISLANLVFQGSFPKGSEVIGSLWFEREFLGSLTNKIVDKIVQPKDLLDS